MEAVSTIKWTEILKYRCFHVISNIHSPVMGIFLQMLMTTMTKFLGVLLSKRQNALNRWENSPLVLYLAQTSNF